MIAVFAGFWSAATMVSLPVVQVVLFWFRLVQSTEIAASRHDCVTFWFYL